jgi:hypothetical protein
MIVPLHLQAVGDELRRQGISQLFLDITYPEFRSWTINALAFQPFARWKSNFGEVGFSQCKRLKTNRIVLDHHVNFGIQAYYALGESELAPPVHDSWKYRGLQTHIDMRNLDRPLPDLTLRFGIAERDFHTFLGAAAGFVLLALAGALGLRSLLARPALLGPFLENLVPTVFNLLYWAAWLVLSVQFHGLDIAGFWSGVEGWSAMITAFTWYGPAALALRMALEVVIARPTSPLSAPHVPLLEVLRACLAPVTRDMIFAEVLLFVYNPQSPVYIERVIFSIIAAAITSAWRHAQSRPALAEAKA